MDDLHDLEVGDRLITINVKLVVKLQALWRGVSVRKKMKELQQIYHNLFMELEESPVYHVYWKPVCIAKPKFLRETEYHQKLKQDENEHHQQKQNTGNLIDISKDKTNEEFHKKDSINNNEAEPNSRLDPNPAGDHKTIINRPIAGAKIPSLDGHVDQTKSKQYSVVSSDAQIQDRDNVNVLGYNEPIEDGIVGNDNRHEAPERDLNRQSDVNREPNSNVETFPNELDNPNAESDNQTEVKDIENIGDNMVVIQTAVNNGKEMENVNGDNVTDVQGQTSCWESESPSLTEQQLRGLTKEELKQHRSAVAMELLWVQQALESRKQYLSLKSQMTS